MDTAVLKIHIMGASCSGSTTLGQALAQKLNIPYFDSDAYFWEQSPVPFTVRRDAELRNKMITDDLDRQESWIMGGSVINWGDQWPAIFDLVVFLYIPHETRTRRLKAREVARYGDALFNNQERAALYRNFIDWAAGYDDNSTMGRNLQAHENWLKQVPCKVLEIRGDTTVAERLKRVQAAISAIG